MKKVTIFSWGYWGWGSSATQFVKAVDAVEAARGFAPMFFVDIRIQRSVRAANFTGDAFKKIVGADRYCWMPGLGNLAIRDRSLGRIAIKDPKEAETLLDLAIECQRNNRRALFFCACHIPKTPPKQCHRYEVGKLVLKEAKRRGINLEVVEWPGGDPQTLKEEAAKEVFEKLVNGARTFPLSSKPDLPKYAGLPWGSIVEVASDLGQLSFMSGPVTFSKGIWHLPVFVVDRLGDSKRLNKQASRERLLGGFDKRSSMK